MGTGVGDSWSQWSGWGGCCKVKVLGRVMVAQDSSTGGTRHPVRWVLECEVGVEVYDVGFGMYEVGGVVDGVDIETWGCLWELR